ncbi:DUF6299 family protein [Streptomyces sp. NPDC048603]|uniref:DUF6299 family protein n=1 Tax=Streptomyces sp. NPDC048603 TaxID=3365577 RepID=UPI00371FC998
MRIPSPFNASRLVLAVACAATAAAVAAAPANSADFGNEISVYEQGRIVEGDSVTLFGTYRCVTPSPSGAVQIQATVIQDGSRLAFGGDEAVCDGEQRKWSATGTLRMTPGVHSGAAGAEVRLQSARLASGVFPPVAVSHLAADQKDVELVTAGR